MTDHQEIPLEIAVPQGWYAKLEDLAKQTGRSQTELVQEALAQYLEVTAAQRSPVLVQIEHFESELANLRQKVTELEPYKQQVGKLLVRLEAVERKLSQVEKQDTPPLPFENEPARNLSVEEADDDDFDDEPDEVLTDFLPR